MNARRFGPAVLFVLLEAAVVAADDPTDSKGYLERGHQWYGKKEWDKAIKDYTEVIRLEPKNPSGFYYRGCALAENGEAAKAIEDFNETIRLDPKYPHAFYGRGNAYIAAKDFGKAVEDLNEAIRQDPKYAPAFGSRGSAKGNNGDSAGAIEDLTEAIRLDPKLALAFRNRGLVRLQASDFAKAIDDLTEAIRLDPKDAQALGVHGQILASSPDPKLRDGKRALEDTKAACEMTGWKSPYLLEAHAAACAEVGDFDEAIKWQKKVLEDAEYMKSAFGPPAKKRLESYRLTIPVRLAPTPPEKPKDKDK